MQWQMQILCNRACAPTVPYILKEMWGIMERYELQSSLQILRDTTGELVGQC